MKTFDYSFLDKHVDSANLGQHDNDNSFLFKDCLLDQFAAWESTHPGCIPIGICPEAKHHSDDRIYEFIAMVYEDENGNRYYVHVPDSWPAEREFAEQRDWAGMKEAQHAFHEKKRETLRKQEEMNRQVMSPPPWNDVEPDQDSAFIVLVSGSECNGTWAARMYATEAEARKASVAYLKNWARKHKLRTTTYRDWYLRKKAISIHEPELYAIIEEDLVILPFNGGDIDDLDCHLLHLYINEVKVPKGWVLRKKEADPCYAGEEAPST